MILCTSKLRMQVGAGASALAAMRRYARERVHRRCLIGDWLLVLPSGIVVVVSERQMKERRGKHSDGNVGGIRVWTTVLCGCGCQRRSKFSIRFHMWLTKVSKSRMEEPFEPARACVPLSATESPKFPDSPTYFRTSKAI